MHGGDQKIFAGLIAAASTGQRAASRANVSLAIARGRSSRRDAEAMILKAASR
jgi:hypothetical protein